MSKWDEGNINIAAFVARQLKTPPSSNLGIGNISKCIKDFFDSYELASGLVHGFPNNTIRLHRVDVNRFVSFFFFGSLGWEQG